MDPQTIQNTVTELNEAMGVYYPADIETEDDYNMYSELFELLRQLHYYYRTMNTDEIKQIFIEFYHTNKSGKIGIINTLKNRIVHDEETLQIVLALNEDLILQKNVYTYLALTDREAKARFLYYLKNGRIAPTTYEYGAELNEVDELEKQIEEEVAIANAIDAESVQTDEEIATTPEDIVSRYLKGSGAYDPALRNTGFRIDGRKN